jgi:hypothetical protein
MRLKNTNRLFGCVQSLVLMHQAYVTIPPGVMFGSVQTIEI